MAEELRADARGIEIAWRDTALEDAALWQLKEICRRPIYPCD